MWPLINTWNPERNYWYFTGNIFKCRKPHQGFNWPKVIIGLGNGSIMNKVTNHLPELMTMISPMLHVVTRPLWCWPPIVRFSITNNALQILLGKLLLSSHLYDLSSMLCFSKSPGSFFYWIHLTHWSLRDMNEILCHFQADHTDWWLKYLLWNCP